MAEIRVSKLLRQFNVGLDELIEFLKTLGAEVEANPNAKVSDLYLPSLQQRFGKDYDLKRAADLIDAKISDILEKKISNSSISTPSSTNSQTIPSLEDPRKRLVIAEILASIQQDSASDLPRAHLSASVKPEVFDWEAFEGSDVYGPTDKKAIKDAYSGNISGMIENEVIEGTVVAITKREVVVNVGGNREGVIPVSEFRYDPDIKVGDKVEVYVESADDEKGQLELSHRKARTLKSWDRVNEAFENDAIVKGFVKTRTKGGMIVDVFGIEAFLPGSQIDIKPIRDYDQFVCQNIDCKIIKINQEFRNVVVSRRVILESGTTPGSVDYEANLAAKQSMIEELKALIEGSEKYYVKLPMFRKIQNRWRETGPVPATAFRDINDTYQFYVEVFYDTIKANRDLRDLDLRKNLDEKESLCEAAEKLAENGNVVEAYKELQKLHEQWKEIGPVVKDKRDSIWERFCAATKIINQKYFEYNRSNRDTKRSEREQQKVANRVVVHVESAPPEYDPAKFFSKKALDILNNKKD